MRRRNAAIIAGSVVAALVIAGGIWLALPGGAADDSERSAAAGEPQRGGDVVFLESNEFTGFAQQNLRTWQNSSVSVNIFDLLVYLDPQTGVLEPWLAESWSANDDYTVFDLLLRDGVTFSDGSELTPEVVVANLDRFAFGDTQNGYTPSTPAFAFYERAEVTGDRELRVHLAQTDTGFLNVLADLRHSIVAQSTLDLSLEAASDITNVVGSGPFVVDSAKGTTEIRLVRREGYDWAPASVGHSGEAYLDSITYIVSKEASSRTGLLLSGQAQLARDIQLADEQQLVDNGFHYYGARPFGEIRELTINASANDIVADVRVRQAIQRGIDIGELIDTVYNERWLAATSLLNEATPGYTPFGAEYSYDPEAANALLDEADWQEKGSDGIRVKDGQRLSLTVYPEIQWVAPVQDAELIALQLARIGIELQIVKVDASTYNTVTKEADNVFYWDHSTGVDVGKLWARFKSGGTYDVGDPDFDALLNELSAIPNGEGRTEIVAQIQDYLLDNALVVPLQETQQSFVTAPNLHGFIPETLGRSYLYAAWLDDGTA